MDDSSRRVLRGAALVAVGALTATPFAQNVTVAQFANATSSVLKIDMASGAVAQAGSSVSLGSCVTGIGLEALSNEVDLVVSQPSAATFPSAYLTMSTIGSAAYVGTTSAGYYELNAGAFTFWDAANADQEIMSISFSHAELNYFGGRFRSILASNPDVVTFDHFPSQPLSGEFSFALTNVSGDNYGAAFSSAAAPVPEPFTMGLGIAGAALFLRRRARRTAR